MNFYPRPPRGGRQTSLLLIWSALTISIHALREEGDTVAAVLKRCLVISIHALREEGDICGLRGVTCAEKFLSTPLREEGDDSQKSNE